jgi:phosphatidylglycerophosphate synthase
MSQGTLAILVGGGFLVLLVAATYWIEARRGGSLRTNHQLAAVTLAFLLVECARLASRWLYIPAAVLFLGAVIDYVRLRRQAGREAQERKPTS